MKCILHIGTEKTATTTIQEFLHCNRQALFQLGYLYTKSAGLRNNWRLPVAAYDVTRKDDLTRRHGLDTDEKLLRFQTRSINNLRKELDGAGAFSVTVFSSEHIQSRLRTSSEVSRLKALLNQLGYDEIQVLVYLRQPVDIVNSIYSTAVKGGLTEASPHLPDHKYYKNVCDHRTTLKRFSDVFGEDSVQPRLFGKQEFKDRCLISDFLAAIGLSHAKASFHFPTIKNERLSGVGIEILRRVNQRVPAFIDERPNPHRRAKFVNYFSEYLKGGAAYSMPEELFRQYEIAFAESNEWVREKYFPEREKLFPKAKHLCVDRVDLAQSELDSIANMVSTMWLDRLTMPTERVLTLIWQLRQKVRHLL